MMYYLEQKSHFQIVLRILLKRHGFNQLTITALVNKQLNWSTISLYLIKNSDNIELIY